MERLRNRNKSGIRRGMKRYVARRNRNILKGKFTLSNDVTRAKIEYYDQLALANGANKLLFGSTNANYMNIAYILQISQSWQDLYGIYSRYKITGISVYCSACSGESELDGAYTIGVPTSSVAFYPNLTTQDIGTNPAFNDHKMTLDPKLTTPQSKYWKFPDQYFEGSGFGFGVWSQTNGYTNQIGQISVTNNLLSNVSIQTYMYNIRIILYVLISDKNR